MTTGLPFLRLCAANTLQMIARRRTQSKSMKNGRLKRAWSTLRISLWNPPTYHNPALDNIHSEVPLWTWQMDMDIKSSDIVIMVMGPTGSGKSNVGEGIPQLTSELQSCTQDIRVFKVSLTDGRHYVFVDTPGFNNTLQSDRDVIQTISDWLEATCAVEFRRYLHPSSNRPHVWHPAQEL